MFLLTFWFVIVVGGGGGYGGGGGGYGGGGGGGGGGGWWLVSLLTFQVVYSYINMPAKTGFGKNNITLHVIVYKTD